MEPEELFVNRFSELIKNSNYTLEEIGTAIGIKSKSTISKYLSGNIKNIKRSQIIKLANFFGVSPAWLAGFSNEKYINDKDSIQFTSAIENIYGYNSTKLLNYYKKLNDLGKEKALENTKDLTKIQEYTEKKTNIQDAL